MALKTNLPNVAMTGQPGAAELVPLHKHSLPVHGLPVVRTYNPLIIPPQTSRAFSHR